MDRVKEGQVTSYERRLLAVAIIAIAVILLTYALIIAWHHPDIAPVRGGIEMARGWKT